MIFSIPEAVIEDRAKFPNWPMMMSPVVLEAAVRVVTWVLMEIPLEAARVRPFAITSPVPLMPSEELRFALPVVSIFAVLAR